MTMHSANKDKLQMVTPDTCRSAFVSVFPSLADKISDYVFLPGFCDVHVHFREPGFSYKETIASGSNAAAHGGYTAVCTMPNLNPVPDCEAALKEQLDLINSTGSINIYPYAAITVGQKGESLSDMEALSKNAIAFSDDGRGVQNDALMEAAMKKANELGKMIVAHCEVNDLLFGGYIHKGEYAKKYNHKGICSESEFLQIARDIELVKKTGCAYHVCHISTKESVDIIRKAKAEGVDITCETAPHYLVLDDSDLKEEGRFKMNPPLRSAEDKKALIEGIKDGTIDMIATDHAPHSAEEKAKPLTEAPSGIIGLETALPLAVTNLVKAGHLNYVQLFEKMSLNPAKLYRLKEAGRLREGSAADLVILEDQLPFTVNGFKSKSSNSPFLGAELCGKVKYTICGGKVVYKD